MVFSVWYVTRHTAGIYRRYDRHWTLRIVRHISTYTGHVRTFDTTSIPLPDTWLNSVGHRYRYPTATGTGFHAGMRHFGKFGTTSTPVRDTSANSVPRSIPVSETPVRSIRQWYRYLQYRYGDLYRSRYRYSYNICSGAGLAGIFRLTSTQYRIIR